MLIWNKELWLIDHGAAFYFHHAISDIARQGKRQFLLVKDHVLLHLADDLEAVDAAFRDILTNEKIQAIVSVIPDEWLTEDPEITSAHEGRKAYVSFLETRVASSEIFVKEAQHAREALI
jgi:hypothetical protein